MIQIIESHFVSSANNAHNAPPSQHCEIVCLGRSNVGKSTFINTILNKSLAKSSATPGKTQLINFFASSWAIDNGKITLTFIDLPGFGYAKVSKGVKREWENNLTHFLHTRASIKLFLHLIDCRHPDMEIDMFVSNMLQNLCKGDQCIMPIYTKADKLTQSAINALNKRIESNVDSDVMKRGVLFSAKIKNHRKIMSAESLREKIVYNTLGLKYDI